MDGDGIGGVVGVGDIGFFKGVKEVGKGVKIVEK